jgi:glutamine amidotransferase
MKVAIVDYGSGNLRSAQKALARAGSELGGRYEIVVTTQAEEVARADRVVLPGVGAFGDCMAGLKSISGMVEALDEAIAKRSAPFLGICVGMQLLATLGREFGDHEGLGWIASEVVAMEPADSAMKIPHMGWNALTLLRGHALFDGIESGDDVYFVHSYEMRVRDPAEVIAITEYGGAVTAAVGRDNIAGVQFHPEKSQNVGIAILKNFLLWKP